MHFIIGLIILLVVGFIGTVFWFAEGFFGAYAYLIGTLGSFNIVYVGIFVFVAFMVARVIAAIQTRNM